MECSIKNCRESVYLTYDWKRTKTNEARDRMEEDRRIKKESWIRNVMDGPKEDVLENVAEKAEAKIEAKREAKREAKIEAKIEAKREKELQKQERANLEKKGKKEANKKAKKAAMEELKMETRRNLEEARNKMRLINELMENTRVGAIINGAESLVKMIMEKNPKSLNKKFNKSWKKALDLKVMKIPHNILEPNPCNWVSCAMHGSITKYNNIWCEQHVDEMKAIRKHIKHEDDAHELPYRVQEFYARKDSDMPHVISIKFAMKFLKKWLK